MQNGKPQLHMTVYVDNVRIKWRNKQWCHLVADSLAELHQFAQESLGLKNNWFHSNASYPHYDVTTETRAKAIKLGALEGTRQQIMECAHTLKSEQAALRPKQLSLFDL